MEFTTNNVIYIGLFLKEQMKGQLERQIKDQHITLQFRPNQEQIDKFIEQFKNTREISIDIVGYANNGKNEACSVILPYEVECQNKQPHITLSVSATGKPVDSGFLSFEPCENCSIIVRPGLFTTSGLVLL